MKKLKALLFSLLLAVSFLSLAACKSDKEKMIDLYHQYLKAVENGESEKAAKLSAEAEDLAKKLSPEDIEELAAMGADQ